MPTASTGVSEPSGTEPDVGSRSEAAARDHALVRRTQAGDEEAFAELVERHEERVTRIAWGLVANREDARDLAQEAFLRVFKSIDRFDFRHDFTTWIYRIVTNLAIDHLRRKRPVLSATGGGDEDVAPLELEDEDAPAPSAALESEETAARVRDCIDALPEHFRSVLLLRELEGLSCARIAEIVGATQVTVRWRLHRGRKLFQDEWERRERMADSARPLHAVSGAAGGPDAARGPATESPSGAGESANADRREP